MPSFHFKIRSIILESLALVLDHDTGGAIKGAGRVDLFCGRGESAKQFAGPLQDRDAEIYYLFPREYLP